MNISEYKIEIKNLLEYENKLRSFKININNKFLKLYEDKECDEAESFNGLPFHEWDTDDQEEFNDKWSYIGSSVVESLFTSMEWDFGIVSNRKSISRSSLGDCFYYDYRFHEIREYLLECDEVNFFFAMVTLANSLSDRNELGKRIVSMTNQASLSYGLIDVKQKIIEGKSKPKVFIAMSFSEKMEKARSSIQKAIEDAGYMPVLLLDKQYNGQIVPEILYELQNSKFVIADFTENKGNVYYEVGYASALEKEIIASVRKDYLKKVEFDTSQLHHIIWSDENDLKERLYNRIVKTVGPYY